MRGKATDYILIDISESNGKKKVAVRFSNINKRVHKYDIVFYEELFRSTTIVLEKARPEDGY